MIILGIHDGHTSTACLLIDGKVIHNVSEERFTKIKGQGGFPIKSIEYILKSSKIKSSEIDKIVLVGFVKPLTSIKDYKKGRQALFPKLIKFLPINPRIIIKKYISFSKNQRLKRPVLLENFKKCGLDISKVENVEHHQTHAAVAYYMSKFYQNNDKTLVITLDGSGDGLAGTISVVENGVWNRLREISSFDSLGNVFGRTTELLAMKPWEHEYKLMGMAPYVNEEYTKKSHEIFKKYLRLTEDGLGFENPTKYWGNSLVEAMRKDLKFVRFDSISSGVQMLQETIVTELVRNWIKKTGIKNLALAGGCFMNIKANKLLMEMDESPDIFIMPSGGDESCALGGTLISYNSQENITIKNQQLKDVYWGPENNEVDILKTLEKYSDKISFEKCDNIELKSAQLLANHKIIGRVSGRMEWGARSLGNRSIIANPSRVENLRDLNIAIKMRDFWMPFAPSILWECRKDYAVYPQENDAYLMTMGFDTTDLGKDHLRAALHPYDQSMRPQFVKNDYNPKYHELISSFKEITGIGGVLNTSFNLHGMPIVNDTEDAIYTLLNSALDYTTVGDFLIWKN